mgnify:CR=1 FL=1|jgi:hypothetical protein
MGDQLMDWLRWILIFVLLSFIWTFFEYVLGGLESMPAGELLGFLLGVSLSMVLPGAVVGGIIGLVTKRSKLGLWIMVTVNLTFAAFVFFPFFYN